MTLIHLWQCDRCGAQASPQSAGWVHVETFRDGEIFKGMRADDLHYCTEKCLRDLTETDIAVIAPTDSVA